MPIGAKVTLRGERMYDFLDKLVTVSLPRVRDFRGVSKKLSMVVVTIRWVLESNLFSLKLITISIKVRGMDVVIVTTAKSDEESHELLTQLGMPFQK